MPEGFTLLELLVAVAVLSIMMVFMFSLVTQAIFAWEGGNRQIEAAQAARVTLDRMSKELQYAIAGSVPVVAGGATPITITNTAPFYVNINPSSAAGETNNALRPPTNSAQIFAVTPVADPLATNGPFAEVGYFCVHSVRSTGYHTLSPHLYYLLWHSPSLTDTNRGVLEPASDVHYRGAGGTNWIQTATTDRIISDGNRMAMVDNCYQMTVSFATNNANGVLAFTNNWLSRTSLPAGMLVTLKLMDKKTAAKIAQLKGSNGLTPADLADDTTTDVGKILRAGTVQVSRFIPFLNSTN